MRAPWLALSLVVAPTVAAADTTTNPADIHSPFEPGTLDAGQVAIRGGIGLGSAPFGFGIETTVGLGGVDVGASASFLPRFCIDLGELGSGCDPTLGMAGGLVQARITHAGPFDLGARVRGEHSFTGDGTSLASAGLTASAGGDHIRIAVSPAAFHYAEQDNPFEENGFYLGGSLSLTYLRDNYGVEATGGAGAPLSGQPKVLPIVSVSAFGRI